MSAPAAQYYPISLRVGNHGSSQEARILGGKVQRGYAEYRQALAEQSKSFDELELVLREAARPNWDGLNGQPLDDQTYQTAKRFLLALPSSLPSPEITVDRDGEVSFDWGLSRGQMFSVSLRSDGRLSFAGQFGLGKTAYGTEEFEDGVPKAVVDAIKRLYGK